MGVKRTGNAYFLKGVEYDGKLYKRMRAEYIKWPLFVCFCGPIVNEEKRECESIVYIFIYAARISNVVSATG